VTEEEKSNTTVIYDTFIEIESSQVFSIMDLALIEKVNIKATFTSMDLLTGLIHVTTVDVPTLQTVDYYTNNSMYDSS
jgi:hypothetical protein